MKLDLFIYYKKLIIRKKLYFYDCGILFKKNSFLFKNYFYLKKFVFKFVAKKHKFEKNYLTQSKVNKFVNQIIFNKFNRKINIL